MTDHGASVNLYVYCLSWALYTWRTGKIHTSLVKKKKPPNERKDLDDLIDDGNTTFGIFRQGL